MKRVLISSFLVFVVLFSGCVDQETLVVSGVKDGVVIKDFSFDSSTAYGGDRVGLNLEVQNVGEFPATILDITLFGPDWATGEPRPSIEGVKLSPYEPEVKFEGESRSTRWRLTTPSDIRTEMTYSVGTRIVYSYKTVYTGMLRVVRGTYLETLSEEERNSLLESSGVISASVTGGPLSVSPVKGRSFIVEEGSVTRPIRFKVTNVGSGYTYTGSIDTGNYQVVISSQNLKDCGVDGNRVIKLSKGKSRIFSCNFTTPAGVVNKMDVLFSITFDYNYYVDGMASISVKPSEIPITPTTTIEETTTTSTTATTTTTTVIELGCTKDFVMGANSIHFYDADKVSILKDNCFNWLRMIFGGPELTGQDTEENYCFVDLNGDGTRNYIDCLGIAEFKARQEAGWDYDYDLVLNYDDYFSGYSAEELGDFTREVVENILNDSNYPEWITPPSDRIGIYDVGGELDFEGFAGRDPPNNLSNPDDWSQIAELLKESTKAIRETDSDAKILLHLAYSHDPDVVDVFIKKMVEKGVEFDYIGFTYYPTAYGNNSVLSQSVDNVAKYVKKVVISEFGGYPSSDECTEENYCGQFGWSVTPATEEGITYPLTETGQKDYLKYELNFFDNDADILGVFYVHPDCPVAFCKNAVDCFDTGPGCSFPMSLIRFDESYKPALNEVKSFMSP